MTIASQKTNALSVLPNVGIPGAGTFNEQLVVLDSTTDTITAHAGGGQGSAVPLTTKINRVTVVASANDSVLLPAAIAGLAVVVNNAAVNNVAVFPQANGDIINALSANTAFAQATGTTTYRCYTTGKWVTN